MNSVCAWLVGGIIVTYVAWELIYGFMRRSHLEQAAFEQLSEIYHLVGNGVEVTGREVSVSVFSYHGGFIWAKRLRHDATLSTGNARKLISAITRFNLRWLYWTATPLGVAISLLHSRCQLLRVRQVEMNIHGKETSFRQTITVGSAVPLWGQQVG